jgi:hypothetical protein
LTEQDHKPTATRTEIIALVLIAFLCVIVRLNVLDIPLNRDEGGFAFFGQLLHQGGALYQDGFDHKPPGIWLWYWLLSSIVDFDAVRLHVVLLVYNLITLFVLVLGTSRFFSVATGLWAGLIYAVASSSWQIEGFSASAEMFMLLPILGSLFLCMLGMERQTWPPLFASGLLAAWCFWIKQPALVISCFLVLFILVGSLRDSSFGESFKDRLIKGVKLAIVFGLGIAIPSILLCGYFAVEGRWHEFIYWSFTHSLDYAVTFSLSTYLHSIGMRLLGTMSANPFAWALAVGTCLILPFYRLREGLIVAGFFLSSLVSACHSPFMYRHYMALVIPALSLAAGVGASALVDRFTGNKTLRALAAAVLVILVAVGPVVRDRHYYLYNTPFETSRRMFDLNPFPESPVVAAYLKERTQPSDRILILGSEPQILVLADRPSATRHVFFYQVVGPYKRAGRFQQEVLQDIAKNRPRYVVAVSLDVSWLSDPKTSEQFLRSVNQWLSDDYALDALVSLHGKTPAVIPVDRLTEAERQGIMEREHIAIFRRVKS